MSANLEVLEQMNDLVRTVIKSQEKEGCDENSEKVETELIMSDLISNLLKSSKKNGGDKPTDTDAGEEKSKINFAEHIPDDAGIRGFLG